jgi:hypothetical protein
MPAIDFPNSPSVNDTHTVGDRSWKWTGVVWAVVRATDLLIGPTGATGPTGPSVTGNTGVTGSTGAIYVNMDGGSPSSIYGGITPLDGGGVS